MTELDKYTVVKVIVMGSARCGHDKDGKRKRWEHEQSNGSKAIIFAFDLADRESFKRLDYWMEDIKNQINLNLVEDPILILVGTKCDLKFKRQVTQDEAAEWAKTNNISSYHETSAKENICIEDPFNSILDQLYLKKSKSNPVTLIKENNPSIWSCC
ncbi:hypothetical protein DFA_01928 [Cavenderia fasciculata]|uniref:Rab GTPase n=1 Tax=Cavenderia fasciculata TaxID=261658 RepID=F4PQT1_CACFS|nr:uncharacterized protein DFA_01928 [Cavenderia fasciculata]EGG22039.1 hypothetical protein DFA_01928 [Cavenderia fasciculata]|eukprot:XP_004359890.1 hypothetical protein DFA_01928 [Cavenderia fasciculata]